MIISINDGPLFDWSAVSYMDPHGAVGRAVIYFKHGGHVTISKERFDAIVYRLSGRAGIRMDFIAIE